ncbi:MAG TPA: prephenate dehydrogenase/arogenate dehydrogenase family protein [Methanomicrobia archaeon]|nr:prephenate dehydrogenase/arogenate dehydrogenase family protein [Methanomicrobia archaeon]
MQVTILGGAGAMGAWFARFFNEHDVSVRIVDVSDQTAAVAKQLGVEYALTDVLTADRAALRAEFVAADIVLVSVPIELTSRVIERIGPALPPGSLFMDISSVKRTPVALMERCTAHEVEVLGTHPLFGPSTKSLKGMPVVFVPVRSGPLSEKIRALFERNGAKITCLTAEEHDALMAVIQGLPHFVLFAFGITLKNLGFDVARARKFMGPMYAVVLDFVGRLLYQDPRLYAQIQTNLEMRAVHETFITAATRLAELVAAGDAAAIVAELEAAKAHFGDTASAMRDSDRIIEEKVNLSLVKNVAPPKP